MIEQKFRAWDKRTRKMIFKEFHILGEVTCFDLIRDWCMAEGHGTRKGECSLLRINSIVITRYTGLSDSHNNSFAIEDLLLDEVTGEIYHVQDGLSAILFENIKTKEIRYFWQLENPIKLIGNTFETPELLKVEK
jgi:hypothetical protein